jgi:hypothetical protein
MVEVKMTRAAMIPMMMRSGPLLPNDGFTKCRFQYDINTVTVES